MKKNKGNFRLEVFVKQVWDHVSYIFQYVRDEYKLLLHPRRALAKFLKGNNKEILVKAISFFVANIIVVCLTQVPHFFD